ncbi:homoserine kinase [Thermoanaerobacter sp. X514]|uniref:homoserine kinase n=1 Tax=Thermoanaerobacter sp. (strain X514) TaxID=399726 RepID=UPI0000E1DE6B|nr:homoserine kinase [Thermoanaerobacter sp. X514]ABY93572.1 homoserine kinase [Thermoanaerobacter sp. X514]
MESDMVKVKVPASSANLGPGFDSIGVALNLYTEISMGFIEEGLLIEVSGEDYKEIETTENNLVYKAAKKVFEKTETQYEGLKIEIRNGIPVGAGLGSSAAAIIGGMLAANELAGGILTHKEILDLAASMEGHADNVAPALNGGLNVTVFDGNTTYYVKKELEEELKFIAFTPKKLLKTEIARNILPQKIDFKDAVFNTGRSSLLTAALFSGRYDLLKIASQDMLHQKYRSKLIPEMYACFEKALEAGAYSVFLSGAGPTIMAICPEEKVKRVVYEVSKVYIDRGIDYRVYKLHCENNGAQVLKASLSI